MNLIHRVVVTVLGNMFLEQFEILALFPVGHFLREKSAHLELLDGRQIVDERVAQPSPKQGCRYFKQLI